MIPTHPHPDSLHKATPEDFLPSISRWITLGGLFLLAAVGAAIAFAAVLKYRVTVKAPATIRPVGELPVVEVATGGIVKSIEVEENQEVKAGDIIAYIENSRLETKKSQLLGNVQRANRQLNQLKAQITALDGQIAAETEQLNRTLGAAEAELRRSQRHYRDRKITITASVEEAEANYKSVKAALNAAKSKRDRYQPIAADGAISQNQLEEAKLEVEQQQQALEAALARLESARAALNPVDAEVIIAQEKLVQEQARGEATLANLTKEREQLIQRRVEIQNQLDSDKQELEQIRTELADTVIRAPVSGIIQQLYVRHPEQVLRQGNGIARIAPSQALLEIKAAVPSTEISQVEIGQAVQMRVGACPYTDYGLLGGTVSAISPDTIVRGTYEVTIRPLSLLLKARERECVIQSGMEGRADIIADEETVLGFIFRKARLLVDL